MKDPKKIFAAMKKSVNALDRTKKFYKRIRCKVDHVVQEAIKRSVEAITAATAAYCSTYDTSTRGRTEQYASYYPIFGEAAGIDTKHAGSNMPYQTKVVRYIVDITMWGVTELREIHTEYKAKTALFEMMVAFEPKAAELIWPETAKKKNKRTPPSLSGKKRQLSETDSDDAPSMMSDALSKRMSNSAIDGPQGSPAAAHETVAQQPSNPPMNGVAPSTSMRPGPHQGFMNHSTGGFDRQIKAMIPLQISSGNAQLANSWYDSYQTNPKPPTGEMAVYFDEETLSGRDSPKAFSRSGLIAESPYRYDMELDDDLLNAMRFW